MQLLETEQIGSRLLSVLKTLLQQRYPDIDLAALGQRCGLGSEWWLPQERDNLVHLLLVMAQLRDNEAPTIALEMGDQAQLSDLGLLGYAMLTSPNCEQAARITCRALSEASYMVGAELSLSDRHGLIRFHVVPEAKAIEPLILEFCAVSAWRYIQGLLPEGRSGVPDFVRLRCPAAAYRDYFEELLGCPITFNETENLLAMPLQWMYRPILTGNEQLLNSCLHHVQHLLGADYQGSSIVPRVKRLLIEKPHECAFKLDYTAGLMRLTPRTLRRQLEKAGYSFRRICLEVRMELSREYLLNTRMSLKEIAYHLGYTHANNFNRAFSDYYSVSPLQYRAQHQAASAADMAVES